METKITRPVWAEINLDNLANNIKEVKRITKEGTLVTAVVKADGYGHGALMCAKTFLDNGADRLAVATLSEAIQLREKGIDEHLLILGYTPTEQAKEVVDYDITQTIYKYEQGKKLSDEAIKQNKDVKVHIKIDSGMSRLGFFPNEKTIDEIIKISKLPNLEIEGIFTHFARADEKNKKATNKQYERFTWVIEKLNEKEVNIPLKHVSNSATIIDINDYNLDMVRAGIMIYGLKPSDEVMYSKVNLKPAMTLKAKIAHIKEVPENTGISYGHKYITDTLTKVGTLPIGYADGYTRLLSNKAKVGVNGQQAPILGNICMDQCMIDLTNVKDVKVGDEVILFGEGKNNSPHTDDIANILGTINYEIVCMVSKRVPRVYVKEGKIVHIKDHILES
ncbi:MAG: alanine racemase [Firmicutes bacterium]|nr:alanine racemase [Bacillota bacterium]